MDVNKLKVTVIGAGNVGFHLTHALYEVGCNIVQIFSRNKNRFNDFAEHFTPCFTTNLAKLNTAVDVFVIAVSDDAIAKVAAQIPNNGAIVVHTSGAVPSTVLKAHKRYGVFYPLQTFTRNQTVDFEALPFCIDANEAAAQQLLMQLAHKLSNKVYAINDQQRAALHVAAVFVNNFTNHLLAIGEQLTQIHGVPFAVLQPLINETFAKIQNQSPAKVQTGPAKRGDRATLAQHKALLNDMPYYKAIYELLSNSIIQHNSEH
jgi:predicted short-subunit dehydrogenase-like oxidoreductase (DUF2520 family)